MITDPTSTSPAVALTEDEWDDIISNVAGDYDDGRLRPCIERIIASRVEEAREGAVLSNERYKGFCAGWAAAIGDVSLDLSLGAGVGP